MAPPAEGGGSAGGPAAAKKTAAKKTAPAKKTAAKKTAAKKTTAKKTTARKRTASSGTRRRPSGTGQQPSTPQEETTTQEETTQEEAPPPQGVEIPIPAPLARGTTGAVNTGAGIVLGVIGYAVLVNYLHGGTKQVRKWFAAKFINDTAATNNAAQGAKPAKPTPEARVQPPFSSTRK